MRIDFDHAQSDLDMILYNLDGRFLGSSFGVTDTEQISLDGLSPDLYIVRVIGFNGATGGYSFSLADSQPVGDDDFLENDNLPFVSFPLPTAPGPYSLSGKNIKDNNDLDWFLLRLRDPGTSSDFVRIENFNTGIANLDLTIYDASFQVVGSTSGTGSSETLSLDGYARGKYFIAVSGTVTAPASYDLALHLPERNLVDYLESNDSFVTATDLGTVAGTLQRGDLSISDDDADVFKFTTSFTGTTDHSVRIDFNNSLGNLELALFDESTTNVVGFSVSTTDNREQVSLAGLPAGTYYVLVVSGEAGGTNPDYQLTLTTPTTPAPDADEQNDTRASATDLGTLTSPSVRSDRSIDAPGDDDWYHFQLAVPGTPDSFTEVAFTHAAGNLDLVLHDATGNVVATSAGEGNSERISLAGLSAGHYYVRVFGRAGAVNPRYTLTIEPTRPPAADAFEPNDTRASARPLGLIRGSTPTTFGSYSLHNASDADWFRFSTVATAGAGHFVSVDFSYAQGDIDARLYDAGGNLLRTSAGNGNNEGFLLAGLPAGDYYLEVYGYEGAVNPSYSVSILGPTGSGFNADAYEPNDTQATATKLRNTQQGTVSGSLQVDNLSVHAAGNDDWFTFTTVATGTAAHRVGIRFQNANGNLDLVLVNAAGQELRRSAGTNDNEQVSLDGLPAGTYSVRVLGATNLYRLSLDTPTGRDDWTILVYMTASTLSTYAHEDINEMESALADLPGSVNIAVLWDQSSRLNKFETDNGAQAAWGTVGRAILSPDTNRSRVATRFEILPEQNTGNPATLRDFVTWATTAAPADRYALILWDHGGGIASNFDDQDGTALDFLSIPEVATALTGGPRMDLIAYDACVMGAAEAVHGLQGVTDVFAGSEDLVAGGGHDYTTLFTSLRTNPGVVSAEALATNFVQSFGTQYQGRPWNTYSAVRTSGFPAFTAALKAFVDATATATSAELAALGSARNNAPSYVEVLRDLGRFLTAVADNGAVSTAIRTAANGALTALNNLVVARTSDPRNSLGLSVLMPPAGQVPVPLYPVLAADWVAATGWTGFLRRIAESSRGADPFGLTQSLPDFAEDNDLAARAYELHAVSGPGHNLPGLGLHSGSDEDWYRFAIGGTGGAADRILVQPGAGASVRVELYDATGTTLLGQAEGAGDQAVTLDGRPAGTYLMRVLTSGGATVAGYTLALDAPVSATSGDWAGRNSTLDKVFALGAVSGSAAWPGLELDAGGEDWFNFSTPRLDAPGVYHLSIPVAGGQSLSADLLDADGAVVSADSGSESLDLYYTATGAGESYTLRLRDGSATAGYALQFEPSTKLVDTFDRPDTAGLGPNWATAAGQLGTGTNAAQASTARANVALAPGFQEANVEVQAALQVGRGQSAGVVARHNRGTRPSYYEARLTGVDRGRATVGLYRTLNGRSTLLASKAVPVGTGTLALEAVGNSLQVTFNGAVVLRKLDGKLAGPGQAGVRVGPRGRVDDVRVTALRTGLPFTDDFEASVLSPRWQARQGGVAVASGKLAGTRKTNLATLLGASAVDVAVEARFDLAPLGGRYVGLVARYASASQYYEARVTEKAGVFTVALYRHSGTTVRRLASATLSGGSGLLRFEAVGTSLRVLVDGAEALRAVDGALRGTGLVGVRGNQGAALDDFAAINL